MKKHGIFAGALSAGIAGYLIYDADINGTLPAAALFFCFFLLLLSCILPGIADSITTRLSAVLAGKPLLYWLFPIFPASLYFLTFVTQPKFFGIHLLYFACYIYVPLLLAYVSVHTHPTLQVITGILAAASIWIPFDHRWYKSFWPGRFPFAYEFCSLSAVLITIFLFLIVQKPILNGYRLAPRGKDFRYIAVLSLLSFILIIPLGVMTGFLEFRSQLSFEPFYILAFIGIFLSIALVEEILFRGVLQNLFERLLKNRNAALAAASVLFGMSHWNNAKPGFVYHYIVLASIAGVFYGLAYRKSNSLFPAIFLHALVDTLWLALFVK
jgi:membrane protease YdiL (CAAX protease family)